MAKTNKIKLEQAISNYFDFCPFVFSVLSELKTKPCVCVVVIGGGWHAVFGIVQ